jgi:hypothetical protein
VGNPGTHLFCTAGDPNKVRVRTYSDSTNQSPTTQYFGTIMSASMGWFPGSAGSLTIPGQSRELRPLPHLAHSNPLASVLKGFHSTKRGRSLPPATTTSVVSGRRKPHKSSPAACQHGILVRLAARRRSDYLTRAASISAGWARPLLANDHRTPLVRTKAPPYYAS